MITVFNYHQSDDEMFNTIVDAVGESVRLTVENKRDEKYDEMQRDICSNVAKYIVKDNPRYSKEFEKKGSEILKNANVTKNQTVRENFNAVIAEIINVAIPTTASKAFGDTFMEMHQVGWGDTARFLISSNDLFQVNEIAEGVLRGVLQPIYNDEITVNCGTMEVATSIDWYAVASGNFDWGMFGQRAGASFGGYIMLKAIGALASATTNLGAAYTAAGVTTSQWSSIVERVSSANGGATVYGIGTLNALNKAIPATVGLQYGLGNEVAKEGFLDKYLGARLVPIDQVIVPGTVNTTAQLAIPNDTIYLIATDQYKPVKVVFEGDSVVIETVPQRTTDKTYGVSMQMKIGVAAIVGSKFGAITLPQGD